MLCAESEPRRDGNPSLGSDHNEGKDFAMATTTIRPRRDLYQDVTARILAELEAGAAPWVKPWSATPGQNVPCNAVTNRPYSCQSASNFDPRSASNFDPLERRVRAVALAPSELVGVAETARARVGE